MNNNIVIIGGGAAAISAVKTIREIDSKINIHVFQNEKIYPYYRMRLTKSLFDNLEPDRILLQKKEWYELNNVNLHLGTEVTAIDTDNYKVILDDGSSFNYNKLLLANGSENFIPSISGIDKQNVYTIRKFDNIQAIKTGIEDKKAILNIGGGVQGLEAAWALVKENKEVIIVKVQERLMPRQLNERASQILLKVIESFNVLLYIQIEKIIGEDKVKGILLKDESTINCDMIIYSIGTRPNKGLTEDTSIKTNLGIIVNEKMETNIPNVYAAGDAAEFNGKVGGLWSTAVEQGKTAGYNIAGKEAFYFGSVPVTTMNAFKYRFV